MASKKNLLDSDMKKQLRARVARKKPIVVHTTLNLTEGGHNVLKVIKEVLQEKFANVFERLLEEYEKFEKNNTPVPLEDRKGKSTERKVYVVEKGTLDKLADLAKSKNTSRDILIESLAHHLVRYWLSYKEREKKTYRSYLEKKVRPLAEEIDSVASDIGSELGDDDPVATRLRYAYFDLDNLMSEIESYIENDEPITT